MSKIARMMQQATAGAGGAGLDVDEVFSTFLYDGNNSTQTITNGIDLSSEGGMVWIKARNTNLMGHIVTDTERGAGKALIPNVQNAEDTNHQFGYLSSFNSNGFTVTNGSSNADRVNNSSYEYASWTFRKAPKFFDIVTYTGNDQSGRSISHNLGSTPGCIIVKDTSASGVWYVWHRNIGSTQHLRLNGTDAATTDATTWTQTPTDTVFDVGADGATNGTGQTYVAYLFAHNNSDGGFGPDADQDIIKCGTYTGGSSNTNQLGDLVNLGFEPQWIMVKNTETTPYGNFGWYIFDAMRGITTTSNDPGKDAYVLANLSNSEDASSDYINSEGSGFRPKGGHATNSHAKKYIDMAIRRGPLAEPTSATDVFAIDTYGGTAPTPPLFNSGFPVDMAFYKHKGNTTNFVLTSRLQQGRYLLPDQTTAEAGLSSLEFDFQDGYFDATGTISDYVSWMWKRAPSYFDVVAWTGTGGDMSISHNLGVVPEMIWARPRSYADHWSVFHKDTTYNLRLNDNSAEGTSSTFGTMTSSVMPVTGGLRANGHTYIAYLFATVAGVSKVGSFSHTNGSGDTNVDCGFSSGARFVLYKQYDSSGSWYVLDSVRGIVAGNDPALLLNSNAAEDSSYDQIDPLSSGFTIPSAGVGTGDYIFYAIA